MSSMRPTSTPPGPDPTTAVTTGGAASEVAPASYCFPGRVGLRKKTAFHEDGQARGRVAACGS
eukprot:scaffold17932_cov58-Phaeocystis_antarctica.AAC.2